MVNNELINKLNNENNFHLSIKSILVSNDIDKVYDLLISNNKKVSIIDNNKDYYEQLKNAYDNNVDYLLYDGTLNILNPLLVVILNGNEKLIRNFTNTLYICKDSKITINLVKKARLANSNLIKIHELNELVNYLD